MKQAQVINKQDFREMFAAVIMLALSRANLA
jgi:hypothetical protein